MARPSILGRLGIELPIVQAGMGGGIAGHGLAAAVSEAGGLGTLGFPGPGATAQLEAELLAARRLTARPLAVNLLLPFAREGDFRVAAQADAVVTFWGAPRRRSAGIWIHQCGSAGEALAARDAGADGVIVQGVEAGGHVRGETPAISLLEQVGEAVAGSCAVWLAGGIADREDVARALERGADAAVLGTRFLLSDESGAHPAYRERLLDADETLLTELFGFGWPAAPHRVVPNQATDRWTRSHRRGPPALLALNRIASPLASRLPASLSRRGFAAQRPGRPLFSPTPPTAAAPAALVEAAPLYAGETVARIDEVSPAAQLVRDLAP
jgi:NAD(P)H-dependent flavin oxidoreductase YrpB (nitropropane dioxygenase family)